MADYTGTSDNQTYTGTEGVNDSVNFKSTPSSGVRVDLSKSGAQDTGASGQDTFISIESVTGTRYIDYLNGSAGDNILRGEDGNDRLNAGTGGQDQLFGGDGRDVLTVAYTQAGNALLDGGSGDDRFDITLSATNQFVTALGGAGDDVFYLTGTGGGATLSLGEGQDRVVLGKQAGLPKVTIADFTAGEGGDVLDLYAYLTSVVSTWDKSVNPFASGLARWGENGGSAVLQVNANGWQDVVVLQGVKASHLTAFNMGGYPPNGDQAQGVYYSGSRTNGTVGNDYIVGSSGTDILVGGAGNDTLNGGYGQNTLTGGAGSDLFVFDVSSPSNEVERITDFDAQLDRIVISYAKAVTDHVIYIGLDGSQTLVLTLDGGKKLELPNVTWETLNSKNLIFIQPERLPVAPDISTTAPAVTETIRSSGVYTIAEGATVHFSNATVGYAQFGLIMSAPAFTTPAMNLTIAGTFVAEAGGIYALSNNGPSMATDGPLNVLVTTTGRVLAKGSGSATGFEGDVTSFTNRGQVTVVSDGSTSVGVSSWFLGSFENSGKLSVHASIVGTAYGVSAGYLGSSPDKVSFVNSGVIESYGLNAYGLTITNSGLGINSGGIIQNSGTIYAYSARGQSNGIFISDVGANTRLENSGTIIADAALKINVYRSESSFTKKFDLNNSSSGLIQGDVLLSDQTDTILNSGRIEGYISLGAANDSLINTGTLVGDVDLGLGNDRYDSRTGMHDFGFIYGNDGNDEILAGQGSQYLFGNSGNDTIDAGAGDDWIDGGTGADVLRGGAGFDTLSFREANAGVLADISAGLAFNGADVDNFQGFEVLVGSRHGDTLLGSASGDRLEGESGNDVLDGRGGDDRLIGGAGVDTLTGGAGSDVFVFGRGDNADIITDFDISQDRLEFWGFSQITALEQQGADTLIRLSALDSVLLKNVQASSLSAGHFSFFTGRYDHHDEVAQSTTSDSPVYSSNTLVLGAGTRLNLVDQDYALVSIESADIDNHAYIRSVAAGRTMGVILSASTSGEADVVFTNHSDGYLYVESTGGGEYNAFGAYTNLRRMDVDNRGTIEVVSANNAYGFSLSTNNSFVKNSGTLSVSAEKYAFGLTLYAPSLIENSGTIIVQGGESAIGVTHTPASLVTAVFNNTGTIYVTAAPGKVATGILTNVSYYGDYGTINNSGTIRAKVAIDGGGTINNTGQIYGDVRIGYNLATVNNSGLIDGDVRLGTLGGVYNGLNGTITGTVYGNSGQDTFVAGTGNDRFDGGDGLDTLDFSGYKSGVAIDISDGTHNHGVWGTDTFTNIEGVIGSAFEDTLVGGARDNVFTAGRGNDSLTLGGGKDRVVFQKGDGVDVITDFNVLEDVLDLSGPSGFSAYASLSQAGADAEIILAGGDKIILRNVSISALNKSNLLLQTPDSPRLIIGTDGVDALAGVLGGDTIRGLGGNDTLYGAQGDDVLYGDDGDDVLYGSDGADKLYGGTGNDWLDGGAGFDTIDGGEGFDTVSYADQTNNISVVLGGGSGEVYIGGYRSDLLNSIENLIAGSGNDSITGTNIADRLEGRDGNDGLWGSFGDDVLEGGNGDDILGGGEGADSLIGGSGNDTASYLGHTQGVTAFLGGTFLNTGAALGDSYSSIENLTGTDFADILGGDEGNNRVEGRDGNDWLFGGLGSDNLIGGIGNDVLSGGMGADALDGGEGIDVAYYREAAAAVKVDALNPGVNLGEAAGDTLTNIENIWGSRFNDTIFGDNAGGQVYGFEGDDILDGRGGDDFFYGGEGKDIITGGAGIDNFFFLQFRDNVNVFGTPEPAEGGDTITDFGSTFDRIIVSRYWFGFGNIQGPAAGLTSQYADFITNGTLNATSNKPTFFWNAANGQLYFDGDGNGSDLPPVLLVTLTNGASLQLGDIWTA